MASELKRLVSTVQVKVDGQDVGIIAGSLEYKEGKPTREVKGLDNGDVTFSENREEAIGMIKFDIPTTKENIDLANTLKSRTASTVSFFDDFGTEKVMSSGVTKNDSSSSTGTDGKITFDYMGTPLG
jgi:hypothetical protein